MRNVTAVGTLAIAAIQRSRIQRDLIVMKRILMLISILIVLRFPTIIFMINGAISGSLYPLTYAIVGLITSICLIFIGIITIHITPQLRKRVLNVFIQQTSQIHSQPIPLNQMNTPVAVIANVTTTQRSKKQDTSMKKKHSVIMSL